LLAVRVSLEDLISRLILIEKIDTGNSQSESCKVIRVSEIEKKKNKYTETDGFVTSFVSVITLIAMGLLR